MSTMTLADAIRLGSLDVSHYTGYTHTPDWSGCCAIGMAQHSHGNISEQSIVDKYPVLAMKVEHPANPNYSDWSIWAHGTFAAVIADVFVNHVHGSRWFSKRWTFDQLVEWIAATEARLTPKARSQQQPVEDGEEVEVLVG